LNPYFLMTVLYVSLAVLAAIDSSLTSFTVAPWFSGLRWLRVHLITLGALTEIIFGLLPALVASRTGQPRPKLRWDIWLTLNSGLATLLIGIPLVNMILIYTGGALIFTAVLLLIKQIVDLKPRFPEAKTGLGRPFYLAGLSFFLLGILLGTGLWFGWGAVLRIAVPIEVHIHANNWGFMAFMFAGLLIDLYPGMSGRPVKWPQSLTTIFWMMLLGALGLVIAPWIGGDVSTYLSVPGIVLHLSATGWLLLNVILPARSTTLVKQPGFWHLVTSYAWIIVPVLAAPLIILKVPGFPGAGIEQNAPQALIYGWVLQFGYGLIPYVFRRLFTPNEPATLGGNWFSLITAHIGGVLLWASIFITDAYALLHGAAYVLWFISMIPIAVELWRIVMEGTDVQPHTSDLAGAD
jgi:cytochrome c oxidase cbb3-type subunit 1